MASITLGLLGLVIWLWEATNGDEATKGDGGRALWVPVCEVIGNACSTKWANSKDSDESWKWTDMIYGLQRKPLTAGGSMQWQTTNHHSLLVAQSPWLLTQSRMACLSHDWSCSASLFSTNRTCGRRLTHDFASCVSLPFISTWTNHRCPITASLRLPFQVSPRGKGRKRSLVARNKK